jgi:hypothetical protein
VLIFTTKALLSTPTQIKTGSPSSPQDLTLSKQALNKLFMHRQRIHPPTHDVRHHYLACISLPIACREDFKKQRQKQFSDFKFSALFCN